MLPAPLDDDLGLSFPLFHIFHAFIAMKRQNDDDVSVPAPAPAKKSRGNTTHAATVALVNSILANPKSYPVSGSEAVVRKSLVDLASYARSLELQLAGAVPAAGSSKGTAARSQADLEVAAEKLRKAAVSGIKKQLSAVSDPHTCICARCIRP